MRGRCEEGRFYIVRNSARNAGTSYEKAGRGIIVDGKQVVPVTVLSAKKRDSEKGKGYR